MTKKHWILLNAAPLSGKDTLASLLLSEFKTKGTFHLKFSAPLKSGLKAFFGLTEAQYSWFEKPENKMTSHPLLNNLSWRQAQIDLAEKLVRPHWGKDTFVKIAVNQVEPDVFDTGMGYFPVEYVIVSDLGFNYERDWFFENKPYRSCTIVNIHRDNCTFKGDSREWVEWTPEQLKQDKTVWSIRIDNNGSVQDMLNKFKDLYYSTHGGSVFDNLV